MRRTIWAEWVFNLWSYPFVRVCVCAVEMIWLANYWLTRHAVCSETNIMLRSLKLQIQNTRGKFDFRSRSWKVNVP